MAHTCWSCKEVEENHWFSSTAKRLEAYQLCFHCDFWLEKIWERENLCSLRYKHCHYWYHPPASEKTTSLGFGGRWFTIRLKNGEILKTNNLWCQGMIPERFQHALPDNCEFLE